ncbi:MAG: class E sortase [Candidatus Levybacteria bacterium]|nr:class E sortase [Candidatus Levybacteria bacterium]
MTKTEIIKFLILRTIGNFLVLFAIFGVLATFGPALYYEAQYRIIRMRGVRFLVENAPQKVNVPALGFSDVLSGPKEQILAPIDTVFNIIIPKIGANARIFPNVDPSSPNIFLPILQKGVAHAKGTVFPGQAGNIYLFAHSTDNFWDVGRYNAIFYLLKDLKEGDDIAVFYRNARHNYKVTRLGIISSREVSFITRAQTGKELLILQTCWPPGTTWQRLLVLAEPK